MLVEIARIDEPRERQVPFTEPEIITEIVLTGLTVRRSDNGLRFVGWVTVLNGDGEPEERRIMARFSMAEQGSRKLRADVINLFGSAH